MAQPSPSEFLTFYRTVTRTSSFLARHRPRFITTSRPYTAAARPYTAAARPLATSSPRPFSTTPARSDEARKDEAGKRPIHREDAHVLQKDGYDVQSENAKRGKADHDAGTGGNATARRDETQSTQRAKEEHPEAPDVVIGMQDERGQKGH
ncbi:hypothetical protein HDK90DRAFT_512430 [Phyllosticta capitalensis]|uniref:Uncharacterized protein n=1 Tax=Phyllosticta capitalensis TaxID=121624 RepID=A0ABR1YLC6_9PEZI